MDSTNYDEDELYDIIKALRAEVACYKPVAITVPDLLDALRLLVTTFSRCSSPAQGGPDPFTWVYADEFRVAKEAIRKAEQALQS